MPEISRLNRNAEGLHYTGEQLLYRITGLTPYNLERLRITLKAQLNDPAGNGLFHVDTLDLYQSRSRECFAEGCTKYLKVQQDAVMTELSQLIVSLEAERIAMRENSQTGSAPASISEEEKREALEVLKSKDLLNVFLSAFESLGYIGEKYNKLIGIIAVASRLQPDPLSLLFLSRPGAGKTNLQNTICKFVPPESLIQYTRLTGQSLFYRDPNALKNKVLAIEEEGGMQEAMYSIKTLISSQKLSVAATRTDAKTGKFSVDEYTVNGPVVVFISTTNPDALDDETKQRFLILTIDESPEQTEKILQAQRTKNTLSWYQCTCEETTITKLHHNMQRLLRSLTVVFPDDLKVFWPYGMLQMRREQGKFLALVKAIALLHQYQRKVGTLQRVDGSKMEYIQACEKDIELALTLGKEIFARNVDDVSPTGRTLLKHIVELVNEKYQQLKANDEKSDLQLCQIPFTRKELRLRIGWSEKQVRVICEHLTALGYLGKAGGSFGATFRYVLLDTGEDDPVMEFRMNELAKEGWTEKGRNRKSTT